VEKSKLDAFQRTQFLAASAPHSGDWLLVLPIASCGLRLDDEAIRVGVALPLGLDLGAPHTCRMRKAPLAYIFFCCEKVGGKGLYIIFVFRKNQHYSNLLTYVTSSPVQECSISIYKLEIFLQREQPLCFYWTQKVSLYLQPFLRNPS